MAEQPGIVKETKDAMKDNEHSIGEKAPGTPFALVALSYISVLLIVSLVVALLVWLSQGG